MEHEGRKREGSIPAMECLPLRGDSSRQYPEKGQNFGWADDPMGVSAIPVCFREQSYSFRVSSLTGYHSTVVMNLRRLMAINAYVYALLPWYIHGQREGCCSSELRHHLLIGNWRAFGMIFPPIS